MFVRIRFPPITEDVLLQAFEVSPAAAILIWSNVTLYCVEFSGRFNFISKHSQLQSIFFE